MYRVWDRIPFDPRCGKHSGELPIIGVNTFVNPKTLHADYVPAKIELARASQEEKNEQLTHVQKFQKDHRTEAEQQLKELKATALSGGNIFAALLKASRHCSLFQMSQTLYEAGGQYRRNL